MLIATQFIGYISIFKSTYSIIYTDIYIYVPTLL